MMDERGKIMESKRRHFNRSFDGYGVSTGSKDGESQQSNVKKISNLYFMLEQMRLNSERERLGSYKEMLEALLNNANTSTLGNNHSTK